MDEGAVGAGGGGAAGGGSGLPRRRPIKAGGE
jgi:hypothetical protein